MIRLCCTLPSVPDVSGVRNASLTIRPRRTPERRAGHAYWALGWGTGVTVSKGLAVAEVAERPYADDRHTKILDAVGELVVERGIHGLTTALVARRARVAPGKFYELFSDKYAVIQAAADRNLTRFFNALSEELDGTRDLDLAELGRVTLEVWIELCRRDPAFRVLRFRHAAAVQSAPGDDADARIVSTWAQFVEDRFGLANTPALRRALTLAVKFAVDPIEYAFELDPDGDPDVLDQVRRVLNFHLSG